MGLFNRIAKLFRGKETKLTLEELEELLLESGIAPKICARVMASLDAAVGAERDAAKITAALEHILRPLVPSVGEAFLRRLYEPHEGPTLCLFVGVNGVGKTTSIAKFARYLMREKGAQKSSISLAAGDTFRAAAALQLEKHAEKLGVACIRQHDGADAAAVIFDALAAAKASGNSSDGQTFGGPRYVLADTAGRMNTRADLIAQLEKIYRIAQKAVPAQNIVSFMVIDGNSGLNTVSQVRDFAQALPIDSVILSKYDGSARGGTLISIGEECGVPCSFLGVGEQHDDLRAFDKEAFLHDFLSR